MGDGEPADYDPEHYLDRVVRPLRLRPDLLPDDLTVRYAIPAIPPVPSPEWIATHLRRVRDDWTSRVEDTPQGAVYRSLLAADRALTGDPDVDLDSPSWWAAYVPRERPLTEQRPAAPEPVAPVARAATLAEPPAPPDPEPVQMHLSAHRVGDEVELRWNWPGWGTHADVRWRERHIRVTRSEYKERGCWRHPISRHRVDVDVVVRGRGGDTLMDAVVVDDRRQEVRYTVRKLRWPPGTRDYELTFSTDEPPVEFCYVDVGWSGEELLPFETDPLERIGDPVPIGEGKLRHVVTVPAEARWLLCVTEATSIDLIPPDVEQLRVGRRPR
jgi:hypothetical protein